MVEDEPRLWSANALLRPIAQDAMLPTAAYVGGPAEVAYHAQIGPSYRHFGLPRPVLVPRPSVTLVEPGGQVFFSTINRNPKAYMFAIIGAEYLLRMLPRGTHDYRKFIRPSELERWARSAGLELRELTGMTYNPLSAEYRLGDDVDVNYLAWFSKPA
jgi:hypothetical protein